MTGLIESASSRASRWSRGIHRFPTVIKATDKAVIRHKRFFHPKDALDGPIGVKHPIAAGRLP
jgi:hypothetical protein